MTEQDSKPTKHLRMRFLIAGVAIAMMLSFVLIRQSSNTTVLGSTWAENGLYPIEQFDHSPLTNLLSKYVDDRGRVDYQSWQQNADDRMELLNYLQSTSRIYWNPDRSPHTSVEDTAPLLKALWINAYNAMTIHAILDIYPTTSVRRHTNPIGFNVWNHFKLMIGPRAYSLSDIEAGPLAELADHRVHFALVKASVGCPPLSRRAYEANDIDQRLDSRAAEFLSSSSNLRLEGSERVHLSPVLQSVMSGFGGDQTQQLRQLSNFIPDDKIREAIQSDELRIMWMKHDWSLNQK